MNNNENDNKNDNNNNIDFLGLIGENKMLVVLFLIISSIWIFIFYILGRKQDEESMGQSSTNLLTIILFAFLIILIVFNTITYFYNINFETSINQMSPETTNIDFDVDFNKFNKFKPKKLFNRKEVFHISDNKYNYENSKALCKAYGARLAKYSDLESAYKKGANWCSYGWSDNQMALFPIQKDFYDELQEGPSEFRDDCGKPGINGGYFPNKELKFGVNCYGFKPDVDPGKIVYVDNILF